jgi:hypothetical protein
MLRKAKERGCDPAGVCSLIEPELNTPAHQRNPTATGASHQISIN